MSEHGTDSSNAAAKKSVGTCEAGEARATLENANYAESSATCEHCDGEGTEVVMGPDGYVDAPCSFCAVTYYVHTGHDGSALHTASFSHRMHAAEHAAHAIWNALHDAFGWEACLIDRDDAARVPLSIRLAIIDEEGDIDLTYANDVLGAIAAQVDRLVHHDGAYRFDFAGLQVRIVPA